MLPDVLKDFFDNPWQIAENDFLRRNRMVLSGKDLNWRLHHLCNHQTAEDIVKMDDLDYDSARIVEEIQQGLRHLDEEEENLVVLRDQLTKVKKFREEQARKDDMIGTLKERIRQLEYEKEFGTRQSAELEEIMSERILTLERSLAERDEVERQFLEYQVRAQVVEDERDALKVEIEMEREGHDRTRMECTALINEVHRLQQAREHDQQVAHKTHAIFEALKTELNKKEHELSTQSAKSKEVVRQLKQDVAVARKATEDMAERLVVLEEGKSSAEGTVLRLKADLDSVHQDSLHNQSEVARWASMYAELEKVLSSLKTQITTAQFSHASEENTLQTELARYKADHDKLQADLDTFTSTLSSVLNDMNSITTLRVPTTITALHHYKSDIVAIVRSMKRFVTALPNTVPHNATFVQIAHHYEELTVRTLHYQEALLLTTSSEEVVSSRAVELDHQLRQAHRELAACDSAVENLVQQLTQAGLVQHTSVGGDKKAETKRVESLDSEYRTKQFESVRLAITSALQKLHDTTASQASTLHTNTTLAAELQHTTQELRSLQQKYHTELEHLHRMNDEALVAVKVAQYESGTEVNRLRSEYKTKFTSETAHLLQEVTALTAEVEAHKAKNEQFALALQHVLTYTAQLTERQTKLVNVYEVLKVVHSQAVRVMQGVASLADCCHAQQHASPHPSRHSSPSAPHHPSANTGALFTRTEYRFEPFIDPLEEAPAPTRPRITFRVAVLHVLAALRFRYFMREARLLHSLRNNKHIGGGNGVQESTSQLESDLPPVYVLRDESSQHVARHLLASMQRHNNHTNMSNGAHRGAQSSLHQEMSMDEFDAYLAQYHREERHNGSNNTSSRGGTSGGQKRSSGDTRTLLQLLRSPTPKKRANNPASNISSNSGGKDNGLHRAGSAIYQLPNVSVLFRTLADMHRTIEKDQAELAQRQTIIESLEAHIRTLEHTLAHHSTSIAQSKAVEEQLRTLISTLEREKRSKSYHILKEIQEELTQDHSNVDMHNLSSSGNVNEVYKSKYVPFGATFPQSTFQTGVRSGLYSSGEKAGSNGSNDYNVSRVSTPPRRATPEHSSASNSNNPPSAVNDSDSAQPRFATTPSPIRKHNTNTTAVVDLNRVTATHNTEASTHPQNTTTSEYAATPHHDFHYADLPDTSVLDTSIDSYISSALFPPPADINWSYNDSFNTHYTGTDKDIHVSPSYAMPDPRLDRARDTSPSLYGRRNGSSSGNGSAEKKPSVEGRYNAVSKSLPNVPTAAAVTNDRGGDYIHPPGKAYTMKSHSTYSANTSLNTTSNTTTASAHRTRASDEIQAIYSDIGRLGSRLQTRLQRSVSPAASVASSANSSIIHSNGHIASDRLSHGRK